MVGVAIGRPFSRVLPLSPHFARTQNLHPTAKGAPVHVNDIYLERVDAPPVTCDKLQRPNAIEALSHE